MNSHLPRASHRVFLCDQWRLQKTYSRQHACPLFSKRGFEGIETWPNAQLRRSPPCPQSKISFHHGAGERRSYHSLHTWPQAAASTRASPPPPSPQPQRWSQITPLTQAPSGHHHPPAHRMSRPWSGQRWGAPIYFDEVGLRMRSCKYSVRLRRNQCASEELRPSQLLVRRRGGYGAVRSLSGAEKRAVVVT